jgi:sulfoxide reductase heme-binding subunit YedZ
MADRTHGSDAGAKSRNSTKPAARSLNEPLGGRSGDWRHRLLRFHLPLALASALILIAFMTLPLFDANAYPHADVFSDEVPQQLPQGEGGPMDHGGDQARRMDHGGQQTGPMSHEGHQTSRSDDTPRESFLGRGTRGFARAFTVATGYLATGLLALTLLIGPANLLLRRRNPVSSYLRRDAGTWTAVISVVHVVYGLQVHGSGRLADFPTYFVSPEGVALTNSFGLANWTGLVATVIVMGLLAISSDVALRKLKARNWKNLQRLNYALFALVIAHAFFYGAVIRTDSPYTLLLLLSLTAVFTGQAVGIWLWRRRHTDTSVSAPAAPTRSI